MKRLFIIGTEHKHQFGPCNAFNRSEQACEAFTAYLRSKCEKLNVKTLAEEMCIDARIKWVIKQTVADVVAADLSLHHADSDPTEQERAMLGISNEGEIKMDGFMNGESDENIQKNIRAEYSKRENEWLCRLNQLKHEPVLFICGSLHSRSLATKSRQSGWKTVILDVNWEP